MKKIVTIMLFVTAFISFACTDCGKVSETSASYTNLAKAKYGANFVELFNPDSSFLICYKATESSTNGILHSLKFFVFNINENKIEFEDSLLNAKIKWEKGKYVSVKTFPEMISINQDNKNFSYYYNVVTKKKIIK